MRLIKLLVMKLRKLWMQRCSTVHAKASDKTPFEELDELWEEVNETQSTSEYGLLVDRKEITSINDF